MRRRTMIGGLAAALIAAGGAAWQLRLFARHYPPTPYDDLLDQIVDREPAMRLGQAMQGMDTGSDLGKVAALLRRPGFALGRRAPLDAAADRVVEIDGWLVPETVAEYSFLAARI